MVNEQITQGVITSSKSAVRVLFEILRFFERMNYRSFYKGRNDLQKLQAKEYKKSLKLEKKTELKHKDLVKYSKNSKLDKQLINSKELKLLKKDLKKLGVKFSVLDIGDKKQKDKKLIFFQAKDRDTLYFAYNEILNKAKIQKLKERFSDKKIKYKKDFKFISYKKEKSFSKIIDKKRAENLNEKILRFKEKLPKLENPVKNITKVK